MNVSVIPEAMMGRNGFAAMDDASSDARFVCIMRGPLSGLWPNVRRNRARGCDEGDLDARFDRAAVKAEGESFHRSDYARTIAEPEAVVPAERIGYFFSETLSAPSQIARMAEFLGIGDIPPDASRQVTSGSDAKALQPVNLAQKARERLVQEDDMAHDRFGDDLPVAWRTAPAQQPSARRDGHGR